MQLNRGTNRSCKTNSYAFVSQLGTLLGPALVHGCVAWRPFLTVVRDRVGAVSPHNATAFVHAARCSVPAVPAGCKVPPALLEAATAGDYEAMLGASATADEADKVGSKGAAQ